MKAVPVSLTISPIKDASGEIVAVSKIVRDTTERKRAEEELRRQCDFTSAITSSIGEGIYALDRGARGWV